MERLAWRRIPGVLTLIAFSMALAACDDDGGPDPTDTAEDTAEEVDAAADADGDAEEDADADADADADPDVAPEADVTPVVCEDNNGWTADVELAGSGASLIEYRGYVGSAPPYRVLRVQVSGDNIGTVTPGVYDLAGTTFQDCEVCVSILTGCASGPCGSLFYPTSGTIEITSVGAEGTHFAGRLTGIEMEEHVIRDGVIDVEPTPGGEDWCLDDYAFDRVTTGTHEAICGRPTVPCLDETVLDFSLESCVTGDMVPMSTLAEGQKALVYTMVTGWCPYCADWMATVTGYQMLYGASGLKVAFVYGENVVDGPRPSADDCLEYAADHAADPNDFYLDHDGTYSFSTMTYAMWPWLATSDTMGLPWSTILDPATYQYVYTSEDASRDFETVMLGLLGL